MIEEEYLIKKDKRNPKYKYIAVIAICIGIILVLSSVLFIIFLNDVTKTEYAKMGDVLINNIKINQDGSGVVEIYNTRKQKINLSGYFLAQLPRKTNSDVLIQAIMDENAKHEISLPSGYFSENSTIYLIDPSGREYLDILAYDSLPAYYFRYPDGSEWFYEDLSNKEIIKLRNEVINQTNLRSTGRFEIHIFDVGQGDSQLIIYPSGYTIFIDNSESNWNTGKGAESIATKITNILGHKNIDVGVISHLHLDHMGYEKYGGFWSLIEKHNFNFGMLIDRDAGKWVDKNSDGVCDPNNEIEWKYAGTTSGTATNWLCYATNPKSKIYSKRKAAQLCSTTQIKPPDSGALVTIITADALGAKLSDGSNIAANHVNDKIPPSENDYSIGLLIQYKDISYTTMGDLDGEDALSSFGYTYNHIEKIVAPRVGEVDIYRANHHGSSHSSSSELLSAMKPTVTLFSCGNANSYGHPSTATIDRVYAINSEMYLTTNCANDRNYRGGFLNMGDIKVYSTDGSKYTVTGNSKTKEYTGKKNKVKGICKI